MKTTIRILMATMLLSTFGCGGASQPTSTQLSKVRDAAKAGQSQCLADSDCATGEACKNFCGNGWCGNVCIPDADPAPVQADCANDADCVPPHPVMGPGQVCQVFCGNGWCSATCVDKAPTPTPTPDCQTDADCAKGSVCTTYCGNGWCDSVCRPAGCQQDSDCDAASTCQSGQCTPKDQSECQSDAACPAGQVCQSLCGNGWCHSSCVQKDVDPVEACVKSCGIGYCAGPSCWSDGNDYHCNDCVAACHGATRIDCQSQPQTCADLKCDAGYHCEMKGINGGSVPACIKDDPDSCAAACPIGCPAPGSICFSDGGNWCNSCVAACHGAVQVDCQAKETCDDFSCDAGYHCEMKGINGGSVPVCIADSVDTCVAACPIGACIFGASCWSDGNDYLCNSCVAACHGAVQVDCK